MRPDYPLLHGVVTEGADVTLEVGGRVVPALRVEVSVRRPRDVIVGARGEPVRYSSGRAPEGRVTAQLLLDVAREIDPAPTTGRLLVSPERGAPRHLTEVMELRLEGMSATVEPGEPVTVEVEWEVVDARANVLKCECDLCIVTEVMES